MAYRHLKQKEFVAGICSWNYRYYKIAQFLKKALKAFQLKINATLFGMCDDL